MPYAAPSPCRHRGCAAVTREGFCDKHKAERRQADDARRGSSASRGYGSKWQKARAAFLAANPLCRPCDAAGRLTPATVVDHVVPHKGDMRLFWRRSNWQPICKRCHDAKTAREDGGFGRAVRG